MICSRNWYYFVMRRVCFLSVSYFVQDKTTLALSIRCRGMLLLLVLITQYFYLVYTGTLSSSVIFSTLVTIAQGL